MNSNQTTPLGMDEIKFKLGAEKKEVKGLTLGIRKQSNY